MPLGDWLNAQAWNSKPLIESEGCCAGLSALELKAKGDANAVYTNITTVIIAAGAVWLPLMHYLMDRRGYGVTLIVINTFGVTCAVLQVGGRHRVQDRWGLGSTASCAVIEIPGRQGLDNYGLFSVG